MSPKTFLKIIFTGIVVAAAAFVVQSIFLSKSQDRNKTETTKAETNCDLKTPQSETKKQDQDLEKTTSIAQVHHKKRKTKRGDPKIGGHFLLTDHKGVQRSNLDFRGRYTLVYFGYSFCPDICPTALYNITEALESLGDKAKKFQPLFITVDPERDTVEELAKYIDNFHPSLIALTGSKEAINKAKRAYHVYAAKASPKESGADYLLDHSSIIYLMDPRGRYVTSFNHATPAETIIKSLLTLS